MVPLPDHLMPAPVGKEQIPKQVLEQHQRDRVLAAAVEVFAERGFQATTVEDLVGAARIGVGTFYALFAGKEDCFLRLYDTIVEGAREEIAVSVAAAASPAERISTGLRALLELVSADPNRARIVVVEAQRAGPEAERRYAQTTAELAAVLREGRPQGAAGGPPASFEDAAVGGLAWALYQPLAVGEPVLVDRFLADAESLIVAPYEKA